MRYAEHAPPDALAEVLHCLWSFEDEDAGAEPQRIVPDGRCELVVHFGAPYRERGAARAQARVVFAGQLTRPLWLEATGAAGVIGARFHPAAARRFLAMPMDRVTDQRLALASRWPGEAQALESAVLAANAMPPRIEAVERFVAARTRATAPDRLVERCVGRLREAGSDVDAIAAGAGIGRRQLERRFRDVVGVAPGTLADIFRFRRVFDAIERDSSRPWTDAALAAGYFDQSHLIRDFHRFVGCTPGEFAAVREGLAKALVA